MHLAHGSPGYVIRGGGSTCQPGLEFERVAGGSTWWESSGRSLEGCVQWRCQELSDVGGDAKGQERGPCFRPSAPTGHKLEGWPTPPSICGSPSPPAGVGGHATSFWSGIPVVAVKGNCPPAKASQGPMSEDGHLCLRPGGFTTWGKLGQFWSTVFRGNGSAGLSPAA